MCGAVLDTKGIHLVHCTHGNGGFLRHTSLVKCLRSLSKSAGFTVEEEDRSVFSPSSCRPDITVFAYQQDGWDLLIDVSVVEPAAVSYLHRHSDTQPMAAASCMAMVKRNKYSDLLLQARTPFCPAVWESHGAVLDQVMDLVDHLCGMISEESECFSPPNWAAQSPSRFWWQRLSIALQNANVRKMRSLLACAARNRIAA